MAIGINTRGKAPGTGGRLLGTLFFGVFFLIGLGFEIMMVRQTAVNFDTHRWAATEAFILSSTISPPRNDEHDPVLHVSYAYTFGGVRHEGDRIETGSGALETSDAFRLAERYATGARVPCWVNPRNPGEAVLQRKSLASAFMVLFPLIFVAAGVFGIWAMWRAGRTQDAGAEKPLSNRSRKPPAGRAVMAVFFTVFLLVGLGAGYAFFARPLLRIAAAHAWVQADCEIVSSRVRTHPDSDGDTYSVDVVYRYTYQGRTYTANRHHFMTGSSSGRGAKEKIVAALPPGRRTVCFVDPDDPAGAVLERQVTGDLWFGLIPLVFAIVGAGGLIFVFRSKPETSGAKGTPPAYSGTAPPPFTGRGSNGPQLLKPAASRKGKLVVLILAALFWNGIVSVFLFNLFSEWRHGVFSWFLALFLTPFVLVGLGLFGGVFYQFMALLNPRTRLTVSERVLLPGGQVDIRWELEGRSDRLQRLQITLEGREEATYRRGTDTSTDREVFARIQITDTTDPVAMHSGAAKLQVPAGTMHSFESSNNKIVWALKVHGDIPRWPDVNDEYPVTVAAQPCVS